MAKKIPIPKVKTKKMSFLDKLYMGIAGLSPFTGRGALHQSRSLAMPSGEAAHAAHRANLLKNYGKWGSRGLRWSGLTNPWTAIPFALGYGAKHAVGKAFNPYMDPDSEGGLFHSGKISTEGHARLAMAARARERGIRKEDMDLEPFLRAQQELELNRPTYAQLRESFLARQNQNEGGIARLL
jgi:hypothetical protein